jgi:hypothetical protein
VDYKIAKTAEDFDDESEWKKFSKACDQRVREADDALKKQLFYIKSELEKYIKELNKTYKDAGNRKVVLAPLPPKLRHAYESKPYDL